MILFIDACVREESRTRALALALIEKLDGPVKHLVLADENIRELDREFLEIRNGCCDRGEFDLPEFKYAKDFAAADKIVIAAPYWDFSFPAILKKYIEAICVTGITFTYMENGQPKGLCTADKLYYVTTAGGPIIDHKPGYGYVEFLAKCLFGIRDTAQLEAEGLDVIGNDIRAIMQAAKDKIDSII